MKHLISYPAGCISVECDEVEKEKSKVACYLNNFEDSERKNGRIERADCIHDVKKGLGIIGTVYELMVNKQKGMGDIK